MSITILGQTGGPTQLSANDDQFGLMTQVPTGAVQHSPAGLTAADGNTAFGAPFKLVVYLSKTATGTTSVNLCSSDCPYKLWVLKVKVRVLDDAKGRARKAPHGACSVVVRRGTTGNAIASAHFAELRTNEEKDVPISTEGNDIVAADASLQVFFDVSLPTQKLSTTYTAVCEIECVRVI